MIGGEKPEVDSRDEGSYWREQSVISLRRSGIARVNMSNLRQFSVSRHSSFEFRRVSQMFGVSDSQRQP